MKILDWLGRNHGVGASSKAIALTALGAMPKYPDYPSDPDDFSRCYDLLALCPEAKAGLEQLGRDGGNVWRALVPRWAEIETAYLADVALEEKGARGATATLISGLRMLNAEVILGGWSTNEPICFSTIFSTLTTFTFSRSSSSSNGRSEAPDATAAFTTSAS